MWEPGVGRAARNVVLVEVAPTRRNGSDLNTLDVDPMRLVADERLGFAGLEALSPPESRQED